MKTFKTVAVFLGPSLRKSDARSLVDADYYPPARKGDVYRIMASGVKTIILIDGVFHGTPAVWQHELLDAMEEGIRVVGASSMGALRAAELRDFGMIGHGKVFEWYRDGVIDGDDEVALLHAPEEFDFQPLSEPLVNIRSTLGKAVEDRCLAAGQAEELIAYAKQLYYPDRSYPQLLDSPVVKDWPRNRVERLQQYFLTKSINIKMLDAIGALRHHGAQKSGRRPAIRSQPSHDAAETWWERERLFLSGFIGSRIVTGREVLDRALKSRVLVNTMRTRLSRRRFVLEWARQNAVACPRKCRYVSVKEWERDCRVLDLAAWRGANGLTARACLALLAERALIHWITTKGPPYFGLARGFVLEWARQHGVDLPRDRLDRPSTKASLEAWIVKKGPDYFGLNWNFETALLQELQITGKAAEFVAKLEAE